MRTLTFLLAFLIPAGLNAQRVSPGSHLRFDVRGATSEGRLYSADSQTITLRRNSGTQTFHRIQIDSAFHRTTKATTGAKIGSVVGGIALGSFFATFSAGYCERDNHCGERAVGAFVGGGLVGAALGAAAGAIMGVAVPVWRRLDPSTIPARMDRPSSARRPSILERCGPTVGAQLQIGRVKRANGGLGDGRHAELGATCYRDLFIGAEGGLIADPWLDSAWTYTSGSGPTTAEMSRRSTISFYGPVVKWTVPGLPLSPRIHASVGAYHHLTRRHEEHLGPPTAQGYRYMIYGNSGSSSVRSLGAGLGADLTAPIGLHLGLGLGGVLRVMNNATRFESGLTVSYRH